MNGSDSLPATQLVSHCSSPLTMYGGRLRLASDARRFDVSRRGHAWVAAAPAVQPLAQVGTQSLHRHALRLANRFRAGIGLSFRVSDSDQDADLAADVLRRHVTSCHPATLIRPLLPRPDRPDLYGSRSSWT